MTTSTLYTRQVRPEGLLSINDIWYQVPTELAGRTIIVDTDRLEYRLVVRDEKVWPVPAVTPLQPGLLTYKELNAHRAVHAAAAETPAPRLHCVAEHPVQG